MFEIDMSQVHPTIKTVLALGVEGSGKTHFASTFPKPILMYSFDGGYQTLAGMEGIRGKVFIDKDRRKPSAHKDFLVEFNKLVDGRETAYTWPDGRQEPYQTVVLDPISFLSQYMMYEIQYNNRTTDKKPNWDEYDQVLKMSTDVLLKVLEIAEGRKMCVLATCHIKIDKDEDTGQMWFLADMLGSVKEKIGSWFDAVFYLKVDKKQDGSKIYQLHTAGDRRERGRLRLPPNLDRLVKPIDDPNYGVLMQRLNQEEKK